MPTSIVDPIVSSTKAGLLDVLSSREPNVRDVYDCFVDYMSAEQCFVGRDMRPCMFEAYGTVIEFSRVAPALAGFDNAQLGSIVTSLRETQFTPLAAVLAVFIECTANTPQ